MKGRGNHEEQRDVFGGKIATQHTHIADWETWKVVVREHPEVHSMLIVELILNCELCILYRLTVLLVDFHLCLRVVLYHC